MEQEAWVAQIKQHAMTIADVTDLKQGTEIKVLVLDRNVYDTTIQKNQAYVPCPPEIFFRENWAIYRHDAGLKGHLAWSFEDGKFEAFEFHLFLEEAKCWYPLTQQSIPAEDEQGLFDLHLDAAKHYSAFPTTTLVGWRGAMVPWEKVKAAGSVYHSYVEEI